MSDSTGGFGALDDIVRNTTLVLEKYERQVLFAYLFGSSARGESTSKDRQNQGVP